MCVMARGLACRKLRVRPGRGSGGVPSPANESSQHRRAGRYQCREHIAFVLLTAPVADFRNRNGAVAF
jgi:hypothetical protein